MAKGKTMPGGATGMPSLSGISPTTFRANNQQISITINGSGFTSSSSVSGLQETQVPTLIGWTFGPTTFVSATQLTVAATPRTLVTFGPGDLNGLLRVTVANVQASSINKTFNVVYSP